MIEWVTRRISAECSKGGFVNRQEAFSFSVRLSAWVAFAAAALTILAHICLYALGLLPYPVVPSATVGAIIAAVLGSLLTFGVTYTIALAIRDLSISRSAFEKLSRTDMLSGLLNRRAFLDLVETTSDQSFLLLFDIDRFKAVNDRFGHDAGDRTIVSVANVLVEVFGRDHVVARIGGEEFAVLIRSLTLEEALLIANDARERIALQDIFLNQESIAVTVSGGIAACQDHPDFSSFFAAADKALYLAKDSGRNLVLREQDVLQYALRQAEASMLAGNQVTRHSEATQLSLRK